MSPTSDVVKTTESATQSMSNPPKEKKKEEEEVKEENGKREPLPESVRSLPPLPVEAGNGDVAGHDAPVQRASSESAPPSV